MLFRRTAASLSAVVVALALAATAVPAHAAPERRGPATVTFTTTGWGHGKGLSQYGARNRAAAGQTWRTIVRTYYPSTTWGKAPGNIRVKLTADTTSDVIVLARSGLAVRSLGDRKAWRLPAKTRTKKKIVAWRIVAAGHRSRIQFKVRGWHAFRTAKGDAEFTAGGLPIVLRTPTARVAYRGILRSTSVNAAGTSRDTVNILPMDHYLLGVVPREVPASWPANAVRAQAVAARTYAAFERRDHRGSAYDLCDTAACQVYGGYGAEHRLGNAAVKATSRAVVLYGGRPAFTQFSASNGGWRVDGGYPYLRAGRDRFDRGAPGDPTSRTFKAAAITRNWAGMGDLVSIKVTGTDPADKRVTEVTVVGTNFTRKVSGDRLRSWFDLRSTLFRIT